MQTQPLVCVHFSCVEVSYKQKGGYLMDQNKVGRFIAKCRKEKGLTQSVLAERIGVSDRAVSKWETGKNMPDSGIMLELCSILDVNVNELLTGERMNTMENYKEKAEENLMTLNREKELHAKRLLGLRKVICVIGFIAFFVQILASVYAPNSIWTVVLATSAIIELVITIGCVAIINQKAGFYECENCGKKYVPSMTAIIFAPHRGLTKYLKCPNCGKWTWNKKRLTK